VESTGSMNHNVHYVERLGTKIDYVISCMHGVAWFEATLIHTSDLEQQHGGEHLYGKGYCHHPGVITHFMGWWFGQALRIMRRT